MDYYAGVYGGSPIDEPANIDDNYVIEARLTGSCQRERTSLYTRRRFPALARFIHAAGILQTVDQSYNEANNVLTPNAALSTSKLGTLGGDVWFQSGPAIAFGEFYWRQQRLIGTDDWYGALGAWGQIIGNVYRNVIGAGVRFNWIDPNTELSNDNSFEVEGQAF